MESKPTLRVRGQAGDDPLQRVTKVLVCVGQTRRSLGLCWSISLGAGPGLLGQQGGGGRLQRLRNGLEQAERRVGASERSNPTAAWSVFAALASSACESSNCSLRRRTFVARALAAGDVLGRKRRANGLLLGTFSLAGAVILRVFFNVLLSWLVPWDPASIIESSTAVPALRLGVRGQGGLFHRPIAVMKDRCRCAR